MIDRKEFGFLDQYTNVVGFTLEEDYKAYTASGIKKEGEAFSEFFPTQEEAKQEYKKQIESLMKGTSNIIIWRTVPEFVKLKSEDVTLSGYNVWSRFAIKEGK